MHFLKNFIILIFACSIGSTELTAQNYHVALGFNFSTSIATAYQKVASTPEMPRFSLGGGVEAKINLNKSLYLSGGAYILDKGFVIEDYLTTDDGSLIGVYTLYEHQYYFSIPVVVVYQPKHLFIGGGPNFNFLLHHKAKIEGVDENIDIDFQNPDFLIGAQLTGGFEAPISRKFFLSVALVGNATFEFNLLNYGVDFGLRYVIAANEN